MFKKDQKIYFRLGLSYGKSTDKLLECVVTKVGRKWIEFVEEGKNHPKYRFDSTEMNSGGYVVDGGQYSSPGVVYENKEKIQEIMKRVVLWGEIRKHVGHFLTPDIESEKMQQILDLLRQK